MKQQRRAEEEFLLFFCFFSLSFSREVSAAHRGGRQEAGEGRPHEVRQPENTLEGGFSGFCGCDDEKSVTVARKQWEKSLGLQRRELCAASEQLNLPFLSVS